MSEKAEQPPTVDTSTTGMQPNNPLSRKLNKILDTRLDNDKEMLEALKSLSTFFTENNLRTRRNLRGDIERRSLAINEQYVECLQVVMDKLNSIHSDVSAMSDCCNDMTTRLKATKDQTHDLINQTTTLQAESQRLEMRSKVVNLFLDKFQLTQDELKTLRGSREGALHPDFFSALQRVKQIHSDCKVLLRTNQQTAGLEIMESMAMHQETAYERLYRWTQSECRSFTGDSVEVSSQLMKALQALQDRPVLYRYSLDEYGTARRTAIVRCFIDALTRGGVGGTPRPIELHSHDPLRYVGDMLAWLHQANASELEYIQALVKECSDNASGEHINDILSHITEGLCRPLKVRLEQVLVSEPGAVVLYKLSNLIRFYHSTISDMMSPPAPLLATLKEMSTLASTMFFTALSIHANKLLEKVELPPTDLSPTPAMNSSLQLLQDVLSSHHSSVVSSDNKKQDFSKIITSMVDPLLQMCSVSASRLNTVDMATYLINCLYLTQTTLALYEFTGQRLEMLKAQIDAHVDTLVSEQASYILHQTELARIYTLVQQHTIEQGPLSAVTGMDSSSIMSAMNKFDNYLARPDSLIMHQCTLLLSAKLRERTKKQSVELITVAYKQLYKAIKDPQNLYREPENIVKRTPDQVEQLLL